MKPYGFKTVIEEQDGVQIKDARIIRKRGFGRYNERCRTRQRLNQLTTTGHAGYIEEVEFELADE